MRMKVFEWTYTVTIKDGKVTDAVHESGESVQSVIWFQAFRITQAVQPNPGAIESQLMDAWRILTEKNWPPLVIEQPYSWITAPLFSEGAEKTKRINLAVLIKRCAFAELQHIASEWYGEIPDLKGRSLSDIRHDFSFQMDAMLEESLISETERNYALRYFARQIDTIRPSSMGLPDNTTAEVYESMVNDILSWYNTKYLVNGYVVKKLDPSELEEVMMMKQYVLLCQTWLQQIGEAKLTQKKLTEVFGAILYMLKPNRPTEEEVKV